VENILGVGWKIEDDDEEDLNPLNLLQPAKGASYPHTRALVKWKDGVITLEGRPFMRRITSGSTLDGDRVIYQKAEELETAYRERHGLGDANDEDDDEQDSEVDLDRGRKHRLESAQYPRSAKTKTRNRFRYNTSEGSDSESDARDSRIGRYTRRRSEPDQSSKRLRDNKKSSSRKSEDQIRKLEKEIQRLRMER
jgi:hypothetical protein